MVGVGMTVVGNNFVHFIVTVIVTVVIVIW